VQDLPELDSLLKTFQEGICSWSMVLASLGQLSAIKRPNCIGCVALIKSFKSNARCSGPMAKFWDMLSEIGGALDSLRPVCPFIGYVIVVTKTPDAPIASTSG